MNNQNYLEGVMNNNINEKAAKRYLAFVINIDIKNIYDNSDKVDREVALGQYLDYTTKLIPPLQAG